MLLGGDLFDSNRPTCSSFKKAMELMNKYCLGDEPVKFQCIRTPFFAFLEEYGHVVQISQQKIVT